MNGSAAHSGSSLPCAQLKISVRCACSRSTMPHPERCRSSTSEPSACTWTSGSRSWWSAWNRVVNGPVIRLPELNDRIRALDVLDEHQTAAGPQNSMGLRYRATIVRHCAQRQGEHSRIELWPSNSSAWASPMESRTSRPRFGPRPGLLFAAAPSLEAGPREPSRLHGCSDLSAAGVGGDRRVGASNPRLAP